MELIPEGARRVEVEIGELVFHGFPAAEARRIAASLEEDLREYLATEFSRELPWGMDGDLAPQLAEGMEKVLQRTVQKAREKGRGDHRSASYRREHHGT